MQCFTSFLCILFRTGLGSPIAGDFSTQSISRIQLPPVLIAPVSAPLPPPPPPKIEKPIRVAPPIPLAPAVPYDFPDPSIIQGGGNTWYSFATGARGLNVQMAKSDDFKRWVWLYKDAMPRIPDWVFKNAPLIWAPDVVRRVSV
jgi:hypothetical protein